jgi:DNA-binding CsgD family transcriptional regulator/tetratricopeptide (TPR) repeat protein
LTADADERVTDAELVAQFRRDPEMFFGVYDRYRRDVYRYVAGRLDGEAADDITAETFLVAFGQLGRFNPERGGLRPWLLWQDTGPGRVKRHLAGRLREIADRGQLAIDATELRRSWSLWGQRSAGMGTDPAGEQCPHPSGAEAGAYRPIGAKCHKMWLLPHRGASGGPAGASGGLSLMVRSPGFVGRKRELAVLAEALAAPPSMVLVEGEAGIGKSRLVGEFLAREPKQRPLVTACPPFRQPYTLGPVVDGVRRAAGQVAGLPLSGLAGALRPLFPEWAADLPPAPEPLPDASAAQHRLFRALAELTGCLGTRLLVVEDVHWADDATLEFLLFLTVQQPQQLSLLLTCRPDEVPSDSLLPRLSSRPRALGAVARLPLRSLSVPETAALISSMLGGERIHPDFAGFVHRHTEGVPLAVEESVRLLADRADLARRGGEWVRRRIEKIVVPPTVRDAVLERAGRLSADAQAVLQAAAVLTEAADEATLAAVAEISPERAVAALVTALDSGLLGEEGGGTFAFRHALAAQAVREAIPAPLRSRMHLRAAQVLEALPQPPAVRLARHFREAGQTGAWCRYAEQAADLALASGDDRAAVALLYEVITAGGLLPPDIVRLARKIPAPALAAEDTYQGLTAALRAALAVSTAAPQVRGLIQYQLSRFLSGVGDFRSARRDLEQTVALLPADSPEAVGAMLMLGWPRDFSSPKSVHLGWLRRAVATVAAVPEGDRLRFAVDEATVLLALGEEEGWDKAAAIPDDALSARDLMTIARAGMNFGHYAIRWGRYAEARRRLDRGHGLAVTHEFTRMRAGIEVTLAHLRWFTGEWGGLAGQAAALLESENLVPSVRCEAMLVVGLLRFAAGDIAQAGECLERVVGEVRSREAPEEYVEPAAALARLRMVGGDADLAVALTDEPAAVVSGKGIWVWAADLVPVRTAALAALGRFAEADGLVTGYAAGLTGHSGAVSRTHLLESRAILAAARGEHEEAAALWASVAVAWRELPRPYDALLADERRAHSLLAVGGEGFDLLSGVLHGLERLGATGDAARLARCLRENGVAVASVWRGGPRGYGTELSPRELDVVRLVVTGQSNRQIAALVHRSPATVAAQLQSAMRKLGVSSRTALAVRVAEAGIVPPGITGR